MEKGVWEGAGRLVQRYLSDLKREQFFFRHTLHFGKVVASKSKLKLLWTSLVHLTIFLAYTQKIRLINIVRKDLECRKNRTSYLLASSSLAYFQAFYIQRNRNLP